MDPSRVMEPDVNPAYISHTYIYIYIHYIHNWKLKTNVNKKDLILRIFTDHTSCTLFRKQTEQAAV